MKNARSRSSRLGSIRTARDIRGMIPDDRHWATSSGQVKMTIPCRSVVVHKTVPNGWPVHESVHETPRNGV